MSDTRGGAVTEDLWSAVKRRKQNKPGGQAEEIKLKMKNPKSWTKPPEKNIIWNNKTQNKTINKIYEITQTG